MLDRKLDVIVIVIDLDAGVLKAYNKTKTEIRSRKRLREKSV